MNRSIIDRIFKNEGGYVNDPDDPGGETNFGISKRYHPDEDIKNLTKERAHEIYQIEYFSKLPQVDNEEFQYHIYDHGVNAGVSRSLKLYNQAIKTDNPVKTMKTLRQDYYRSIASGKLAKFLKGWLKRTEY